jgi:hypothetical protein
VGIEVGHEGIGVQLLDVPDAGLTVFGGVGEQLLGGDHGGDAGGVADALTVGFFVAVFVVFDVVDVVAQWLAIFADAFDPVADAGLAFGVRAEGAGLWEQGLQKFDGDDGVALVHDGVDAGHADVDEDFHVFDVGVAKGHPEAGSAHGEVLGQGLQLFVVKAVDVLGANAVRKGEAAFQLQGFGFNPLAVFPVTAVGGDFAQVDLGIKIGGKGFAVIACVAVDDVERVDAAEVVLQGVGGIDVGDAGIKAAAEQSGEAGSFEALLIGPLPVVFKLGDVTRFVVGGVDVMHTSREAGVHDGEVLIGQGDVDDDLGFEVLQEGGQLGNIVGVHSGGLDRAGEFGGDGVALGLGAGGQHDLAENVRELSTFVGDDTADAAGSDDEGFGHKKEVGSFDRIDEISRG